MVFRSSLVLSGIFVIAGSVFAQTLGSAFTYQGQLTEAGQPATGLYDLQICLFDDPNAGAELACSADLDDVPVEDGVFTVALDFGDAVFVGEARWIELRIRDGADTGGYTVLLPRQPVRPAPEALRAARADSATTADSALVADTALSADTASTADSATTADTANSATTALSADSAPWTGLTGVPTGFADGVDDNSGGTVIEIAAGTGLEGGPITTTGTIGIADGGVGSAQIAPGAVGAPQIDPAQVQVRVSGICDASSYVRGINADGSVLCSPLVNQTRLQSLIVPGIPQGRFPSIEFGSDGNPIISFWNYAQGRLQVRHCASPTCGGFIANNVVDDTASVGAYTSLEIGMDGLPIISYQDLTNGTLRVAKCIDVACAAAPTITPVDADPINEVGRWTSMALGSDGLPIIAYQDFTNGTLKVAKCSSTDCTGSATITVLDDDPANEVGTTLSMTIGSDGFPVVAYHDATRELLKVAKCNSTDCSGSSIITTIVDGTNNEYGGFPSIAIGADGLPIISYWDSDAGALMVAKCIDAACASPATLIVVDDPVDSVVGAWTSMRIGPGGRPSIAYWDNSRADPKFVRCADPICEGPGHEITGLPNGNIFEGQDISLTLNEGGAPYIAQWSNQENSLRLIVCGTLNCQ